MSYHSQVGLAIKAITLAHVRDGYPQLAGDPKKILDDADTHIKSEDGNHLFIWDCIKWYDDDLEIKALMDRLAILPIEQFDDYFFMELGESRDQSIDLGGWSDNDFDLCVTRQLSYDDSIGESD
jgi:hypothetical protein